MRTLAIDIETYSSVDLIRAGAYKYASAPDFTVLLFAYAFDDEAVKVLDLASGEVLPPEIITALFDESIIKTAYNANFERTCLSAYLKQQLSPTSWRCTAVQAASLGLPQSLAGVGLVLALEEQKMTEGKDLIRFFCIPCKPTKTNGGRTRNMPSDAPEKWSLFKKYCIRDVEVELAIRSRIARYPISDSEQELFVLDQQINDTGVTIDFDLVENAIKCDELYKSGIFNEAKELTGVNNPGSVAQLKEWLLENGVAVESLSRKVVSELAENTEGEVKHLLQLRLELAKTSIMKYGAIQRAICDDQRVRGLLQFYGANRSGRWAGRIINCQNLPQNKLPDLDLARNLVKSGDFELLELLYESVPVVLSQLIRTAFVPSVGNRFIVADFSAIEARIIAWLAGERWVIDAFNKGEDLYIATASQMFNVPIEKIVKGNPEYELRSKGKIATLACGYAGGVSALVAMGAIEMGIPETDLQGIVSAWRQANSKIVRYWYAINNAAITAVRDKTPTVVGNVKFRVEKGILFITLPSGRSLAYVKPRIEINKFDRECIAYEGLDKKWIKQTTYGGKLVENIVQGIARDCLAESMVRLNKAGYKISMHVHDEVVLDAPNGSVEDACSIMGQPLPWAEGLVLRAEGFETNYYKKE